MASTGFLITTAGQARATVANPGGPFIHITEFRVGSAFNYTPIGYVPGVSATSQTALQGTTLYTSAPSAYTVVSSDTVEITLVIPPTVSSMNFGELGIYLQDGTLFAVCVFDGLQQHEHAVGNNAGTNWRIRARLKLQQLPAICQVTLINSQGVLEVPDWQSLFRPDLQPSAANIAIVHENNESGDPVLVVRDSDQEWGLVGYTRVFNDTTSGAVVTTSSYTKAEIASISLDLPSTTSKYLIKFSDGSIRKIVSGSDQTVNWSPPTGSTPTGSVQIFQSDSAGQRISWVDTLEYNSLVADLNKWWASFNGTWPVDSNGLGQPALPTLTRRTTQADWTNALQVLSNLCEIRGIAHADIVPATTDFVYRPVGNTPGGLRSLQQNWDAVLDKLPALTANRFSVNNAAHDFNAYPITTYNSFFADKTWTFRFTFSTYAEYQRAIHSGMQFGLSMSVTSPTDASWNQLQTLLTRTASLLLKAQSITRFGPGPTGTITESVISPSLIGSYRDQVGVGFLTQYGISDSSSGWQMFIGREFSTSGSNYVLSLSVTVRDNISPSYYTGGSPGQLNFSWTVNRPQAVYVGNPVIPFPTLSVSVS